MVTDEARGVVTLCGDGDLDRSFRRAVARIDELGLEVLAVIDHSGEAADAGLAMPVTKVVMFGSPTMGTELMLAHPLLALDLPLKLLIREGDDDGVFVSYNAPSHVALRYGLSEEEADVFHVVEVVARSTCHAPPL